MIVLHVTYHCKPGMRERFYRQITAEGLDAACRKEAGNRQYDYYLPVNSSNELLLIEKWEDADALAVHGKQPHFARIGELKAEYVEKTDIERLTTQA